MNALRSFLVVSVAAAAVTPAAGADSGGAVWARSGCGGCHTLAAAGSRGTAGPNLDQLRPSAAAVAAQVSSGGGGMPSFAGTLSAAQISAVAAYVSASAGGSAPAGPGVAATGSPAQQLGLNASAVKGLQRQLARLHYFHHAVTGFYGPVTIAAVKRFQAANGLKPDGLWGPRTSRAVLRRLGGR